jgi:hypothetical protein
VCVCVYVCVFFSWESAFSVVPVDAEQSLL